MATVVLIAFVALLGLGALAVRRSRARALAKIRANWGQPISRERKMETIAASHRSRLSNMGSGASLDDRTWDDLDLDAVFVALDRTESTLGQHALYHRLRTVPVADNLEVFEALVSRLEADRRLRERAQTALSRLRDPHGYDLWWLARQDAIETRPWYVLFPILTAATILLIVLAPIFAPIHSATHRHPSYQCRRALRNRSSYWGARGGISADRASGCHRRVSPVCRGRRCPTSRRLHSS